MFKIKGLEKFGPILETTKTKIRNSSSVLRRNRFSALLFKFIKFVFWLKFFNFCSPIMSGAFRPVNDEKVLSVLFGVCSYRNASMRTATRCRSGQTERDGRTIAGGQGENKIVQQVLFASGATAR